MNGWSLVYEGYDSKSEKLREALCALGNGYVVTRGASPDASADESHYPGTYFAGIYNRLTTEIGGRPIENEDLVNWPNWLVVRIRPEDEDWLSFDTVELLDYRQELSLRDGMLHRHIRFRHGAGRITAWRERRLVSMHDAHIGALGIEVTPENWSGSLTILSALDGTVRNTGVARYRSLANRHTKVCARRQLEEDTIQIMSRTRQSHIEVAMAARTRAYRDGSYVVPARRTTESSEWIGQELDVEVHAGSCMGIEKLVSFCTSRDRGMSEPGYQVERSLARTGRMDEIVASHATGWQWLWEEFDFCLETEQASDADLKLRLHVFHLLQTVSPFTAATDAGMPARGWHGEAYRGHVFWDEIFALPMLNLRMPLLSRALLRYRYRRLPEARQLAADAGIRGAMFPWQSGSDGREEAQRVHLNPQSGHWTMDLTHLQRHVSAAVAWSVWQYYQVTNDQEFLSFYGAEVFVEIARFWASIAEYNEDEDRYEIRGVVGPDEFHTAYPGRDETSPGIDNNAYTNVFAAWVLARAGDLFESLSPARQLAVERHLGITEEERLLWDTISRRLKLAFHEDGIISQFEGYEDLAELDWDAYREKYGDIARLDRILESEGDSPNRYKVSKQADALMLFYVFSSEELTELFTRLGYVLEPESIPRTIEYYSKRTSAGSTLSYIVHTWVEARAKRTGSWQQFLDALSIDMGDIQNGTTSEGIHLGAMAGTVDILHRCYTGFETREDILHLAPMLPVELRELRVTIRYRKQRLLVTINHHKMTLVSAPAKAAPITVCYRGNQQSMRPGDSVTFEIF